MSPQRPRRPCPVAGCPALLPANSRGPCPVHAGRRRACLTAGCPGYAEHRGYCASCNARARGRGDAARLNAARRGYGHAWRQLRARFLRTYRSCEDCGAPATEVHHRLERARGGTDDPANLAALCKPCHSRRSGRRPPRPRR